jgi:hypothetical protein
MARTATGVSWCRQRRCRHNWRWQGEAWRANRYRRYAVAFAPGRPGRVYRAVRACDRGRMPPSFCRLIRGIDEAGQSKVCTRANCDPNPARRSASDHIHAVRADPPYIITPATAPHDLEVIPRIQSATIDLSAKAAIQDVFRHVATDPQRTAAIGNEVINALSIGRKILVLTERTEHVIAIDAALT